jgi:hypothetical protein
VTSQIDTTHLNIAFPIQGQDNPSQGFRDNFTVIKGGLNQAKIEITALESNAVLTHNLTTDAPAVNDLAGSTIKNGVYNQFYPIFNNLGTHSGPIDIDLQYGSIQQLVLSGNATLTFRNWPTTGQLAKVQLMLIGDQNATRIATFASSPSGYTFKTATGWAGGTNPPTVTLGTTGKMEVIEIWTVDAGTNIYVKNVGEY